MPHVNHLPIRTHWVDHGTSPFAQPVAAITAFVQTLPTRARAAFLAWRTGRRDRWSGGTRPHADWESRRQEQRLADAPDLAALEGLQRAFDRRDGDSMRNWDQR